MPALITDLRSHILANIKVVESSQCWLWQPKSDTNGYGRFFANRRRTLAHRAGLVGPHGWRFCELECIDGQVEHEANLEVTRHLKLRDLLCACEICTEHGLSMVEGGDTTL